MARHNTTGSYGENVAVAYLEDNGFVVIERNWHDGNRHEIDIVAIKDSEMHIVEVKTRSSDEWQEPQDAVDDKKRMHIVRAANAYLKLHDVMRVVHFDILTVVGNDGDCKVTLIEDAFDPHAVKRSTRRRAGYIYK